MPTTAKGLYMPDAATAAPMVPILQNMQTSVDTYLNRVVGTYADVAARDAALPTPTGGMTVITLDYQVLWLYNALVSKWVVLNKPVFPSTATRDAVLTSPVTGDECIVGTTGYLYNSPSWVVVSGPWSSYTPTVTGITIGNGTVVGRYSKVVDTVIAEVLVTLGSTSAVTGGITVTLPTTSARGKLVGTAVARPNASSSYSLVAYAAAASTLVAIGVPGTNGILNNTSSTSPATWASTGWLLVQITYEAA